MLCAILPISEEGMNLARQTLGIPEDDKTTPIFTDALNFGSNLISMIQQALGIPVSGNYDEATMQALKQYALNKGLYLSVLSVYAGNYPVTTCELYRSLGIPVTALVIAVGPAGQDITPGADRIMEAVNSGKISLECGKQPGTSTTSTLLTFGLPVAGIVGLAVLRNRISR